MKLAVHAIARLRGPFAELADDYARRITSGLTQREITAPTQKAEGEALLKSLPAGAFVVLLDERGKDLTSLAFAAKMKQWEELGKADLVFIIGGADGVTQAVKDRADFLLGLGAKTWPHKLVRVMLIEQIYRAQQINAGHPYHREGSRHST